MKAKHAFKLLCLFSFHLVVNSGEAKSGVSLNEAVNQAKSEGRVLSAKTINGRHEIKILTRNGTVKTINKQASQFKLDPNSKHRLNNFNHSEPQTIYKKYQKSDLPRRSKKSRNQLKLKDPNNRSQPNRQKDYNRNKPNRPNSSRSRSDRNSPNRSRSNQQGDRRNRDNDNNNSRRRDH